MKGKERKTTTERKTEINHTNIDLNEGRPTTREEKKKDPNHQIKSQLPKA